MSPTRGTPTRPIRVEADLWDRFGALAEANSTDRSALIRDFMHWYCGDPKARMPRRPHPTRDAGAAR